jgi:signal transduction histidine kinase
VRALPSLKYKLLVVILPLCLVPVVGISAFSYFVAKERITEDRIVLYLQQIAAEVADAIQLTILEKKEETVSMTLYGEFREYLTGRSKEPPVLLLDKLILVHEVYDIIALFDADGRLLLTNSIDRNSNQALIEYLNPHELEGLRGQSLLRYTPDSAWLQQVRSSRFGYIDWHQSPLVHKLYRYLDNDIAKQYSIGFAAPILDERNVVVGGILALMNWEFIQEMLDKVEEDLQQRSLGSGYAFLFGRDQNTIIGHKYRRNRKYPVLSSREFPVAMDNYGSRLVEDHGLVGLQRAIREQAPYFQYQYPPGTNKISGLSVLNHEYFQWVCGVGINDDDIFAPVAELKNILIYAASGTVVVVVLLTWAVARRITTPLNNLSRGARAIAGGDLSRRVEVRGRDEIAQLATSFNEMAASLEQRSRDLLELNRNLEEKVTERTRALEEAGRKAEQAYHELKEAQFQLIQSEKLASLGQLVAGIAHEIKNPLNFIYGNTEFLRRYVSQLQKLVALYEAGGDQLAERVGRFKQEINYEFLEQDLSTLIANFEEGAKRIHDIISDLRTFSRMDSEEYRAVDLHESIELALSLLQNEYRGRIEIIKDYGALPPVECHKGRMGQVFMNLLLNACQAIHGAGEITIRTGQEDSDWVFVSIADTGVGIPKENLDRIFEPFFTTKPVGTGTGLGLSISFAIIQQHRGRIDVRSTPGQGTEFRIRLPIRHYE